MIFSIFFSCLCSSVAFSCCLIVLLFSILVLLAGLIIFLSCWLCFLGLSGGAAAAGGLLFIFSCSLLFGFSFSLCGLFFSIFGVAAGSGSGGCGSGSSSSNVVVVSGSRWQY